MKKILIASLMLVAANAAFAAKANVALAAGITPVTVAVCAAATGSLLQADVKVNLSAANIGNVSCDSTTATIGIAVASTTGKFNVYGASSAGGGVAVSAGSPLAQAPVASDLVTAADAESDKT